MLFTPNTLMKYITGDSIKLNVTGKKCEYGSFFPLIGKTSGRNNDHVWSKERGRVNLGNISNCTKDVNGILRFQIVQNDADSITVKMITNNQYKSNDEVHFLSNLQDRIGNAMTINILNVDTIPQERSGKYALIKNSIKLDK